MAGGRVARGRDIRGCSEEAAGGERVDRWRQRLMAWRLGVVCRSPGTTAHETDAIFTREPPAVCCLLPVRMMIIEPLRLA